MGSAAAWAVPAGVLGAICVVALLFVWWWFPRTWKKGVQMDMDRIEADGQRQDAQGGTGQRMRTREENRAIIARFEERQRQLKMGVNPDAVTPAAVEAGAYENAPPAYTRYDDGSEANASVMHG